MITVTKAELPPIDNYIKYLRQIWMSHWLTNDGTLVQLLGKRLEEYLTVKNLALLSNGTLALQIALKALSVKGEVVTTPFTFAATTNVLIWEGLKPVFADIDLETYNIDPNDVADKITDKTSAILAVHVYGNPCYVNDLQEIAEKHNISLIYDAAHAFGVEYEGHSVLNYGDISTLSFHATKIFNTIEGGATVSKDDQLISKIKLLRNHGIKSEEEVVVPGTNAKMNEFQAAMGLCNLDGIDERTARRKILYEYYIKRLCECEVAFQKIISSRHNYSYMPIRFANKDKRDKIYDALLKNGIKSRKYFYPLTVNFNYFRQAGNDLVEKYHLEDSNSISNTILCLPLYHDLEMYNVENIISIIEKNI